MSDLVILDLDGDIALVTLNRPAAMNSLSAALRRDLCAAMDRIREDDAVHAVVLTGAGQRAFSAGLDLKELAAGTAGLNESKDEPFHANPVAAIEQCGKPVIGAINGVALTGGFELALACDIRIGSTNARFADTHALVGIIPGWGLSQKLSRTIGLSRAKEMSLTGRFIDATTACAWGLINRIVEPDMLVAAAMDIARDVAALDPEFLKKYRALIDEGYAMTFSNALALEAHTSGDFNKSVQAAQVAARRQSIQARGKTQL